MGLDAKGFETFLPMEENSTTRWRGKRKVLIETRKPLFSRYLFVAFDPNKNGWGEIKNTDGIEQLLSYGPVNNRIPMRVPLEEIEKFKRWSDNGVFDFRAQAPCGLAWKDKVRVADLKDPFYGFIGEVLIAKPNKRVEVMIDWLNQKIKAEWYAGQLEKM